MVIYNNIIPRSGERSIQPAITIVQTAKFIYAWVLLTSNG